MGVYPLDAVNRLFGGGEGLAVGARGVLVRQLTLLHVHMPLREEILFLIIIHRIAYH
jgi:hypothetical protein